MIKKIFITIGLLFFASGCGSSQKELREMPSSLVGVWGSKGDMANGST